MQWWSASCLVRDHLEGNFWRRHFFLLAIIALEKLNGPWIFWLGKIFPSKLWLISLIAGKCKMSDKVVAKTLHVPLQELFITSQADSCLPLGVSCTKTAWQIWWTFEWKKRHVLEFQKGWLDQASLTPEQNPTKSAAELFSEYYTPWNWK